MIKKMRMTKQRQVVLEILRGTTTHPTADWIYEEARKTIPDISLGTVYRNLQLLLKVNEIQEFKDGSKFSRFDGNTAPHYHFVCKDCGAVFDIEIETLHSLNEEAAAAAPGRVEYHRLEFCGTCDNCLKKGHENEDN